MKFLSAILYILLLTASAHGQSPSNAKQTPATKNATASSGSVAVLVGAGDIASCGDLSGAQATAKLLDSIPGTVFAVGDLAYPDASGYVRYFGTAAGDPKKGYYSYDLGLIVVATMISRMVGTPAFSDRTEFSVCTGEK
jgi:hypothetical protein